MSEPPPGWSAPGEPLTTPPAGAAEPAGPGASSAPTGPPGSSSSAAAKPGVIPLRPLGVGEILDGAISYIRANPGVTLGLSAIVIAMSELVYLPTEYLYADAFSQLDPAGPVATEEFSLVLAGGVAATLFGLLVNLVAVTLLTGLLIVVLSRAVVGQRTSLRQAWTTAKPRLLGLLGIAVLITLLVIAVFVLGVLPIVVAVATDTSELALVGILTVFGAVALMIYLWIALAMAAPAYVLERVGVLAALSRSRRLVNPAWWRVFGILLLGVVLTLVISFVIAVPFEVGAALLDGGLTAQPVPTDASPALPALLVSTLGLIVAGTITTPFFAGVIGLVYFDQRIRREAWDLELARTAAAER